MNKHVHETAMSAAFEAVGYNRPMCELKAAIYKFFKQLGTKEQAFNAIDEVAKEMIRDRRAMDAVNGHQFFAKADHPVEDGEALSTVLNGQSPNASPSSPNCGREGWLADAVNGHSPDAAPVRKQNQPRKLAALAASQEVVKRGYLILMKTSDGRPWGKVGYHELDGMVRDGDVARRVKARCRPPKSQFDTIDELISDAEFADIFDATRKQIKH